jgi:hypothetical protein
VAGEDLASLLETAGRLDPHRTVRLLALLADALDTAHRAKLVHRDIKPSNLIVTAPGTPEESVTLVDFGISRPMDGDSEITRTGEIVGTIAYCAPEQLSRDPIDGACDQYALACVAYECLTGSVPFPREGQLAIMTAHLTAPPPRASAARPGLPTTVDAVLARAMAKEPAARYPTCTQFVTALEAALPAPGEHPQFPAPDTLAQRIRAGHDLVRPAGHPDALALRFGWGDRGPVVARLVAEPLAVRGEPEPTAACVRWLLAQVMSRHEARDVCLAAALAPAPGEGWLWVNWLPHARPSTPPVRGPHVATTVEAAADLVGRLHGVGGDHPRVVAILDTRLGLTPEPLRRGVHPVYLLPAGAATSMSTVDVVPGSCRLTRAGQPPVDGTLDGVTTAYVRELVDLLAED